MAAVCYSLLESAKLAELEAAAYLAVAMRRAIATPGTVDIVKAFSMAPARAAIDNPGLNGVAMPIVPDRRRTGSSMSWRNGSPA